MADLKELRMKKAKEEFNRLGIHSVQDYEKAVKEMKDINLAVLTCAPEMKKEAK